MFSLTNSRGMARSNLQSDESAGHSGNRPADRTLGQDGRTMARLTTMIPAFSLTIIPLAVTFAGHRISILLVTLSLPVCGPKPRSPFTMLSDCSALRRCSPKSLTIKTSGASKRRRRTPRSHQSRLPPRSRADRSARRGRCSQALSRAGVFLDVSFLRSCPALRRRCGLQANRGSADGAAELGFGAAFMAVGEIRGEIAPGSLAPRSCRQAACRPRYRRRTRCRSCSP